jgi:hypothetical protein
MSDFELNVSHVNLKSLKGKKEIIKKIALNDPKLNNFTTAVKDLLNSLRDNKCDWKVNDNFLLMNIIQYGLTFTKKLKKMNSEKKKKLILSLILNILETECKKNEDLIDIKEKIVDGIETVVEPALELAMMTQNNEFKIPKNFVLSLLKVCKQGQN